MKSPLVFLPLSVLFAFAAHAVEVIDDRSAAFTPPKASEKFSTARERWLNEAFPVGNGRLGALVAGGVTDDRIQFNEETLWTGDEDDTGAFQNFGEIILHFDGLDGAKAYRRTIDIERAVVTTTFEREGVKFEREYFASAPAGVVVMKQTASKPASLTGSIALNDAHDAKTSVTRDELFSVGAIPEHTYAKGKKKWLPLRYESRVRVVTTGGSREVKDGKLFFTGADSVTLYLDAGTDFSRNRKQGWRGVNPAPAIAARLAKAQRAPYAQLLSEHIADYRSLFTRAKIDLGGVKTPDTRVTATRLYYYMYKMETPDLALEEMLFDYGRYLLISSSRAGGLPATLQGKWNDSNDPPWRCDYHTDVNIQMNYWAADSSNLSPCFLPYAEWIESIREVRTEWTKLAFAGARGWAIRGESGLFGGSTWDWVPAASAWLLQNSYDHYRFTLDKNYLKTRAYPAMKEVCHFWIDRLKKLPDGTLVSPQSFSPEHGPVEDGVSFDQQLVWDLFNSTAEAADALRVDADFAAELRAKRDKLFAPRVGSWGQLREWMVTEDDKKDWHRHISHLIAVFPCRQITPRGTPELAAAAKVSLDARGDANTGWSTAQKINTRARLADGEGAHRLFGHFMSRCIYRNMFCAHPPFQIDGNFGYVSGVIEMLMQSHTDEIELLPAMPKVWMAKGSFKGLRARGDYIVDCAWENGKVVSYRILAGKNANRAAKVKLRVNGESKEVLPE